MADQDEHYERSWILHHILDRMIGSREIVDYRRKMTLISDKLAFVDKADYWIFNTGSASEGFHMEGSDTDFMFIYKTVEVMCSDQGTNMPSDNRDMTVVVMRKADCRPCYVTLELVKLGRRFHRDIFRSLVPFHDRLFLSSEIDAMQFQEMLLAMIRMNMETHGPSSSLKAECSGFESDADIVLSYSCTGWPPEANEWLSRHRQHGWPKEALIYDISQSGCHVVPVGDKTSADTFLQWRISFATAERKLIHSLNHEQFLVYGLLKYFLKQISERLNKKLGDIDILSSYIMKTVLFFAVENTPKYLWKEQNTFMCFMVCLKMLIAWVNVCYCPNYFIVSNNMFQGKLHGGNQEKLVRFLMEMYNMKWTCLSIGTFIQPSIGVRIQRVMDGHWKDILISPNLLEYECDFTLFRGIFPIHVVDYIRYLTLLSKSQSDTDEFIAYFLTVKALSYVAMKTFEEQQTAKGNKQKYKTLRKCKNLMGLFATTCASPGLLLLATFYYQTGNYMKALRACGTMLSTLKYFVIAMSDKDVDNYQQLYCGHRYTLLHKCREVVVFYVLPEFERQMNRF